MGGVVLDVSLLLNLNLSLMIMILDLKVMRLNNYGLIIVGDLWFQFIFFI